MFSYEKYKYTKNIYKALVDVGLPMPSYEDFSKKYSDIEAEADSERAEEIFSSLVVAFKED